MTEQFEKDNRQRPPISEFEDVVLTFHAYFFEMRKNFEGLSLSEKSSNNASVLFLEFKDKTHRFTLYTETKQPSVSIDEKNTVRFYLENKSKVKDKSKKVQFFDDINLSIAEFDKLLLETSKKK